MRIGHQSPRLLMVMLISPRRNMPSFRSSCPRRHWAVGSCSGISATMGNGLARKIRVTRTLRRFSKKRVRCESLRFSLDCSGVLACGSVPEGGSGSGVLRSRSLCIALLRRRWFSLGAKPCRHLRTRRFLRVEQACSFGRFSLRRKPRGFAWGSERWRSSRSEWRPLFDTQM